MILSLLLISCSIIPSITNASWEPFQSSEDPRVTKAVPAVFPVLAAVARVSGDFVVEVQVEPNGTVARVMSTSGSQVFESAAEISALKWVFNKTDDSTLKRSARLTFSFKLIPRTPDPQDLLPVFLPPYGVEIRGSTPSYDAQTNSDPPNNSKRRKQQ